MKIKMIRLVKTLSIWTLIVTDISRCLRYKCFDIVWGYYPIGIHPKWTPKNNFLTTKARAMVRWILADI